MTIRISISGFGRIDRLTFRRIMDLGEKSSDIEAVTINDLTTPALLTHLLKYDSAHNTLNHGASAIDDSIVVDGKKYYVHAELQTQNIPWIKNDDVDFTLGRIGFYTSKARSGVHLKVDAECVLISAPVGLGSKTIVYGINDDTLTADDKVVSADLCTTNSLVPMVSALQKEFGIEVGTMTTIHACTSTQMLLDGLVRDGNLCSTRATAISIIPHSTGAAKAIDLAAPELNGRLDGHMQHVPVPDGSVTELVSILSKDITIDEVNEAVKKYGSPSFAYSNHNIVSSDVLGMTISSIFDPTQTAVTTTGDKQLVKAVAWYDNRYSSAYRMIRTLLKLAAF